MSVKKLETLNDFRTNHCVLGYLGLCYMLLGCKGFEHRLITKLLILFTRIYTCSLKYFFLIINFKIFDEKILDTYNILFTRLYTL